MTETAINSFRSHEREFREFEDRFYKRSFRPDEYHTYNKGVKFVPPQSHERLRNEAECLKFVSANTTIPVPKVLEAYEEDGSFILVTERVIGRDISDLQPEDQRIVMDEVEGYVKVLQSLRSDRPGGPTGIVCPLPRVVNPLPRSTSWSPIRSPTAEFVFCHCDLGWNNIFIDNDYPRIRAILDWEYAGFWPAYFELPYFRDLRATGAQFIDAPEWTRMKEFFASQHLNVTK